MTTVTTPRRGFLAGLLSLPLLSLFKVAPAAALPKGVKGKFPVVEIPGVSAKVAQQHRDLCIQAIARTALQNGTVIDLSRVTVKAGRATGKEHALEMPGPERPAYDYAWMRCSFWVRVEGEQAHEVEHHYLTRTYLSGEVPKFASLPPLDRMQMRMANGLIPLCAVVTA